MEDILGASVRNISKCGHTKVYGRKALQFSWSLAGAILLPRGLQQCLEVFLTVMTRGCGASGILWVEAGVLLNILQQPPTTENCLVYKVRSAEGEKCCHPTSVYTGQKAQL